MTDTKKEGASRRDFLKLGAAAAPAAALAATATDAAAEEVQQAPGIKDTEHTRAYLASARF
jgi:uncharacterized protein (DUF1501 family)